MRRGACPLIPERDPLNTKKGAEAMTDFDAFPQSGRRDSNPRPSAWKADALAN